MAIGDIFYMHVALANGCWWTCTCNMHERALECLESMNVRGCHDHDPSINLVLLMRCLKFSIGFLYVLVQWEMLFHLTTEVLWMSPSRTRSHGNWPLPPFLSTEWVLDVKTQVAKKHGSISTGTWLAFATTWIGGLPDLIGEVKLSAISLWQSAVRVDEVS